MPKLVFVVDKHGKNKYKLPNCPICQNEELYLIREKLRCYRCSFDIEVETMEEFTD
jgi:hypothetical protein